MAWGSIYAFMFPFLFMAIFFKVPVLLALVAAAVIALIGGPGVAGMLLFFVPYSRRFPFWIALPAQVGGLFLIGAAGFILSSLVIGGIYSGRSPFDAELVREIWFGLLTSDRMKIAYGVTLVMGIVMLGWNQVSSKLGGSGVTWGWITGRYHRPRIEEKVFMFLDIKDSTPLAEKLGDLKFSAFVQRFFLDLGISLEASGGRVSHFIGDEAVIYWKPKAALRNEGCVRFFHELKEEIESRAEGYQKDFGVVPGFKAGIHMGQVVATEVGYGKTEIVYHGDVLNTTARIVGKCSDLGADLLLSGAIAEALLAKNPKLSLRPLGSFELKGKAEKIEIYAADGPPNP